MFPVATSFNRHNMGLQYYFQNIYFPEKSFLLDDDTIKIGRSQHLQVCLLSVWISKHHATIEKRGDIWTITDENSLNGIFINKERIAVNEQCVMNVGDNIQIGNAKDEPFSYILQRKPLVEFNALKNQCSTVKKSKSERKSPKCVLLVNNSAQHKLSPALLPTQSDTNDKEITNGSKGVDEERGSAKLKNSNSSDCEVRLKQLEEQLRLKEEALKMEKEKSDCQAKAIAELEAKRRHFELQLDETRRSKEEERRRLEEKVNYKMVTLLKKKEKSLQHELQLKRQALEQEKEKMSKEMNNICSHDKVLIDKLMRNQERLQKVIDNKDAERQLLESQLKEAKESCVNEKEIELKTRSDVLNKFSDLFEMELQCSICNELFVQTTTLSCSHSFCLYCIQMWTQKKNDCPMCRTPITSQTRALVVDTYIDKMVSFFSPEMKEKRAQLVKVRKDLKVPKPKTRKRKNVEQGTIEGGIHDFLALLTGNGFNESYNDEYEDYDRMLYVW